jgi:hypothetical protein
MRAMGLACVACLCGASQAILVLGEELMEVLEEFRQAALIVDDLDVELRAVPHRRRQGPGLGTRMVALGPRQGESTEEIIRILREGREAGGRAAPPEDM